MNGMNVPTDGLVQLRIQVPISTLDFLELILPEEGPHWVLANKHPDAEKGMNHESFDSIEKMVARFGELETAGMEEWHAVASFQHPIINGRGRTKENVARLKCFFLDIDVDPSKPGKAYAGLDDAENALTDFMKAFGVPYHLKVESGGGLHVYWLLESSITKAQWEPVALKFKNAVELSRLLADPARTADAASLMRPAGTTNRKSKYGDVGRPVKCYRYRYGGMALDEFEAACDRIIDDGIGIENTKLPVGPVSTGVVATSGLDHSWYYELPDEVKVRVLRSMLSCLPVEQVAERTDWLAVGMSLACESHLQKDVLFQLFADWSQSTPDGAASWNEVSFEQHRCNFDTFNRSGIAALFARAYKAGWQPDMLRRDADGLAAYQVVNVAYETRREGMLIEQAQTYLKDNVIYIASENQYLHDGVLLCRESLNMKLGPHMPRTSNGGVMDASALVKKGYARFADYTRYKPGAPCIFLDTNGRYVANTYAQPNIEPTKPCREDVQTFIDFLRHLDNDDAETKAGVRAILKKMAYLYLNPSARIRHATVLIGKTEGSGKSTLMQDIPIALFGYGNVHVVESRDVNSNFNGYAEGARVLLFPELLLGKRVDAQERANNLKPLITDGWVSITRKGCDPRGIENTTTIFATSNYEDAAFFGINDRRYHIVSTSAPAMPVELAKRIHELIEQRPGVLLWLVQRISELGESFDPNAAPPQTSAKLDMLEANRSELGQRIFEMRENGTYPFFGDAVAIDDIRIALYPDFNPLPSKQAIRRELMNIAKDAVPMQAMHKPKGDKRVIVHRNAKKWKDAGPSALYDHYEETVIKKR